MDKFIIKPPKNPLAVATAPRAVAGYVGGLTVMWSIASKDLLRAHKLNAEILEEAWAYLPTDVKTKFNDSVLFYNISIKENL